MKKSFLTLLLLLCGTLLASCGGNTDATVTQTTEPAIITSQPEMTNTVLPGLEDADEIMLPDDPTNNPLAPNQAQGVTSMEKAKRVIEQLEDELERLSEVEEARVIIAGHRAAVALEFDDQYKAGIDDRLRGIVRERVDGVIGGIDQIQISDDKAIMETLDALHDKLDSVGDMSALQTELDRVFEQMNADNKAQEKL